MATRTGAAYLKLEGMFCPPDEGGCGVFEIGRVWHGEHDDHCENCNHRPLASVTMLTNDNIIVPVGIRPDGNEGGPV